MRSIRRGRRGLSSDGRERLVLEDGGDPLRSGLAAEGKAARGPLEEDDAEREDVGAVIERLASQLLGRHVGDRPGEIGVQGGRAALVPADHRGKGKEDAGQAEVEDLDRARRVDHDVLGLEVAVDDAAGVGGGHRARQGQGDLEEAVEGDAAGLDELRQRLAVDELHGEKGRAFRLRDGEDGDDVGMAQGGDGLGFALEEGPPLGIAHRALGQELDGHVAVELEVAGLPDDAHAAFADLLDQAIIAEDKVLFEDPWRFALIKDTTGIPKDLSTSLEGYIQPPPRRPRRGLGGRLRPVKSKSLLYACSDDPPQPLLPRPPPRGVLSLACSTLESRWDCTCLRARSFSHAA